jgi:hypothetical protein
MSSEKMSSLVALKNIALVELAFSTEAASRIREEWVRVNTIDNLAVAAKNNCILRVAEIDKQIKAIDDECTRAEFHSRANVPNGDRRHQWTNDEERAAIKRYFSAGISIGELMHKFGCTTDQTIKRYIN